MTRTNLITLKCKAAQLGARIEEHLERERERIGQELDYLVGRYTVVEVRRG